jgi:hypothetical protein
VFAHRQIRLHGVDESRDAAEVRREAKRGATAERNVGAEFRRAPQAAAADGVDADLGEGPGHAGLGRVGYVADGAGQRAGPEKRALRSAQHLDAIGVEEIEIRREERQ